jgi:hypothetical protein
VDTLLVLFQFNTGPFAARLPGEANWAPAAAG